MQINKQIAIVGIAAVTAVVAIGACSMPETQSHDASTPELETTQTSGGSDPLASNAGFGYGAEPSNVQGIVNRVHAIVVARITSFGGSRSEGPYVDGVLTDPPTPVPGEPSAAIASGYFSFDIEKVLLDDGYVTNATRFRGAPE